MDKEKIKSLIAETEAAVKRTPWLDIVKGALHTALLNLEEHQKAIAKPAAAPPKK